MNHRSLKVGLACAFGAFIGSIMAIHVGAITDRPYFWWLGIVIGGGVGYLSYEFKMVLQAIPVAWRTVSGWRPDWEWWRVTRKIFIYAWLFSLTPMFWMSIIVAGLMIATGRVEFLFSILLITEGMIGFALFFAFLITLVSCDMSKDEREKSCHALVGLVKEGNLFVVHFYYLPKYTWIGVRFALLRFPWLTMNIIHGICIGIAVFGLFVWTIFKLIHSEGRVLCSCDAAIGAGIGYLYNSPLIGMLAGGIFGVLNYEILSKRVLKLVPVRSKTQ